MPELVSGVRLLSHHVDALELSCEVVQVPLLLRTDPDQLEALLRADHERANATLPTGPVASAWSWVEGEPVQVLPSALRRGARYAIESSDWTIFVARVGAIMPRFIVQIRADYLLRVGPLAAYDAVTTWVEQTLLPLVGRRSPEDVTCWRATRVDLAADVSGVTLKLTDLERFTTRAAHKRGYDEGKSTPAVAHAHGHNVTGLTFGKRGGGVFARIYDKTRQADADAPIREVWVAAGQRPGDGQVHRVEFELRGAFLGQWADREGGSLAAVPRVLLARHLDAMWAHLMTRWLVLRDARSLRSRIERRPAEPWWQELGRQRGLDGASFGPPRPLSRRQRSPIDVEANHRQIAGLLASIGAHHGNDDLDNCVRGLTWWLDDRLGPVGFRHAVEAAARRRRLPVGLGQVEPDGPEYEHDEYDVGELFHVATVADGDRACHTFRMRRRGV